MFIISQQSGRLSQTKLIKILSTFRKDIKSAANLQTGWARSNDEERMKVEQTKL